MLNVTYLNSFHASVLWAEAFFEQNLNSIVYYCVCSNKRLSMKKFIVFICLLFSGLSAFAVDDTAEGSVSYDVFAPEKIFGAKLNAELTAKEDCNFFLLQ